MARFYRTAAFAALMTALGLSAVVFAQQTRVTNNASNVAANVTNDVLRRAGAANDPLPGAWLSYGRTPGRDALQHAEADRRDEREAPGPGVVVCHGRRRRQSGRHAADVEQHALRHHDLERCVRAGRPHGQGTVALGSRSQPDHRAAHDLLRHRESGHRASTTA